MRKVAVSVSHYHRDAVPYPPLTLVFPKSFEYFKFLEWLMEKSSFLLFDVQQVDAYEYHLYLFNPEQGSAHFLQILLVGESDINFYGIFARLVSDHAAQTLLVGSCGSGDFADLGKLLCVTEAVKGDRGKLDQNLKFKWDSNKKVSRTSSLWNSNLFSLKQSGISSKMICSTNFLNMNVIDPYFQDFLFDMETYDFFDICAQNAVSRYGCIRFVTDYVLPLDGRVMHDDVHKGRLFSTLLKLQKQEQTYKNQQHYTTRRTLLETIEKRGQEITTTLTTQIPVKSTIPVKIETTIAIDGPEEIHESQLAVIKMEEEKERKRQMKEHVLSDAPSEIHESDLESIKRSEEEERGRRIESDCYEQLKKESAAPNGEIPKRETPLPLPRTIPGEQKPSTEKRKLNLEDGITWERLDDKAKESLPLPEFKKYFRLRMQVDFSFVIQFLRGGGTYLNIPEVSYFQYNVMGHYDYFRTEYLEKLALTLGVPIPKHLVSGGFNQAMEIQTQKSARFFAQ